VQTASTLATAVVPWTEHYEFDADSFILQVRTIARGLTRHIYLFGTAGEGYAASEKQFDQIARAFWESSQANQVSSMLGVISLSTPTIVDRIRRGHALGYRAFQLSLPSWGGLNEREPGVFFTETCGRFPDWHFQHFNLLRTVRLQASVEHRRLAAIHPDFMGVKAGTADPAVVAALLSVSARLRFFFTQLGYAIARRTHETGLLISLASVNYKRGSSSSPPTTPTAPPMRWISASWARRRGKSAPTGSPATHPMQDALARRIRSFPSGRPLPTPLPPTKTLRASRRHFRPAGRAPL